MGESNEKVQAVMDTIVVQEISYRDCIEQLVHQYKPLILISKKLIKSPLMDLFSVLELIASFTRQMVKSMSLARFDCVRFLKPFIVNENEILFLYSNYCVLLTSASDSLNRLSHKDKVYQLIKKTQTDYNHGLPLSAQLLKPFQHLFSYEIFLGKLRVLFEESGKRLLEVDQAYEKMKTILERINELKRRTENRVKLKELTTVVKTFGVPKHIIDQQGELIYEGYVFDVYKETTRYLILFEKSLFITKKFLSTVLICKALIPIRRLKLHESNHDKVFLLEHLRLNGFSSIRYIFRTRTSEDKVIWIRQISRMLQYSCAHNKMRTHERINTNQLRTASFREAMRRRAKECNKQRVQSEEIGAKRMMMRRRRKSKDGANNLTVESEYLNRCCCKDCSNEDGWKNDHLKCKHEERLNLSSVLPRTTSLKGSCALGKQHSLSGRGCFLSTNSAKQTVSSRLQRWMNVVAFGEKQLIAAKSDVCLNNNNTNIG